MIRPILPMRRLLGWLAVALSPWLAAYVFFGWAGVAGLAAFALFAVALACVYIRTA